MSLFKRKQSKEKDLNAAHIQQQLQLQQQQQHEQMGGGPAIPPFQSNGPGPVRGPGASSAQGSYGPGSGGAIPVANGRRMTSNPVIGSGPQTSAQHPHQPFQGNQSVTSLPQSYDINNTPPTHSSSSNAPLGRTGPGGPVSGPGPGPTSYPWSTRPLRLYAPQTSPPSLPQSPFPRYGLSVPSFPSHSGHMLIFGGLVHESVRNDLWSMDVRDCTTMPVKTKGDAPMPRVGHASAIADRIMLVWGGDTKIKQDDVQDEALYILDLRTQEWTTLPVNRGPIGRYGHAVSMHETKFYVFGGQAEGAFMDDLWSYDIRQLSSSGTHQWEQIKYKTAPPPKRTGHVITAYQGKIYVFGGTDGLYHYNDTWALDLATGEWAELSCIGYIPVPREGHAVAIVDDVMYIFGGRDVNGKDLGDLAAFRITNQRWYMFQNMGPAPSPRSGHAMVAAAGKIFVVGGEANASSSPNKDDPSLVHILDTLKIKYPPNDQPPRQIKAQQQPESQTDKGVSDKPNPSEKGPLNERAVNLPSGDSPPAPVYQPEQSPIATRGLPPSASSDSLSQTASPPMSMDRLARLAQSPPPTLAPPLNQDTRPATRSEDEPVIGNSEAPANPTASGARGGPAPPSRPRRDGDEQFRRAMSPVNGPPSPTNAMHHVRMTSPTGPASPPQLVKAFNASAIGTRSPSPRMRMAELGNSTSDRPAPPSDAFYYGRSPTTNGFSVRPGSLSSSSDLMKEIKARESDIEAGKKREAALRLILSKAVHEGFVTDQEEMELPSRDSAASDEMVAKLTDALVRLKQEKASIQTELAVQVQAASDKANNAERLRRGALQEAAFYRAKLATLEANAPIDLARIEKERINELERQLAALAADHSRISRQATRSLSGPQAQDPEAERESEAHRRAEEAESAHQAVLDELEELQAKHTAVETALREHSERLISLSSTAQQREAERDQYLSQLEEASSTRDQHLALIEQAQAAITTAGSRTAEVESLHLKSLDRVHELEAELSEARSELEAKTREVELIQERMTDVENAYAKSREEADSLRTVTTGRLGELLDSHRSLRSDESRALRGHQEQLRALEVEGSSLRKMLKEAGQRVDAAEAGVTHHQSKARDLHGELRSARSELRGHKAKITSAHTELARYKGLHSAREAEVRDREMAVTEMETRVTVLRNLLADHGIAVTDADLDSEHPDARELETKLRDRTRAHDSAQREIEELTRRCQEAEDKVESLGRLVDRIKDARSPTSMSARSPSPGGGDDSVVLYRQKMAEMESKHQEKIKQVESDYQTAVRYVKGSEKMLKRMKDELNKQKSANATLQSEIDTLSGRSSTEPGSRTREASGRGTPTLDGELSRRFQTLQAQHSTLQAELTASRDVLAAREREVDLLRQRVEEAEKEVEVLRDDLAQAQNRINTLLEMGQPGLEFLGSEDETDTEGPGPSLSRRRGSNESSEEASMAFDKFSKELKQWDRTRSAQEMNGHHHDSDDEPRTNAAAAHAGLTNGHKRHSSEYSGDWVQ